MTPWLRRQSRAKLFGDCILDASKPSGKFRIFLLPRWQNHAGKSALGLMASFFRSHFLVLGKLPYTPRLPILSSGSCSTPLALCYPNSDNSTAIRAGKDFWAPSISEAFSCRGTMSSVTRHKALSLLKSKPSVLVLNLSACFLR